MEVYPIHHQNLFFNIITDYDLTFKEIRGILDYLISVDAFHEENQEWGGGQFYTIRLGNIEYEVDVNYYEVVIFRRTEISWAEKNKENS